jgi:molybdopterin-guanine dinucleotide biosynthesis protein A
MVLSVDTPFVDETIFQTLLDADTEGLDALIARTHEGVIPYAASITALYRESLNGC